jgi:hypothetical protein
VLRIGADVEHDAQGAVQRLRKVDDRALVDGLHDFLLDEDDLARILGRAGTLCTCSPSRRGIAEALPASGGKAADDVGGARVAEPMSRS